jgi:thioredoxin-related protein
MNGFAKKLEIVANVAIIVLAILLGGVIVKRYFFTSAPPADTASAAAASAAAPASAIKPGSNVELANYNWSESDKTLVMVLSTTCHFCTESGPFYKRLIEARADKKKIRVVAVFPQTEAEGREYLQKLGIVADEIKTATPLSLGARGTPTLILTDSKGVAVTTWIGKLPTNREDEVLKVFTS